ncbi:hypothetical protein A8926_2660 [Saccharopolyspora spinosa]|uniref:Uncharacterized protein n=1 Tax=Saccharopolyspora spinosa TaxID=60894 RepID=A0A2N3XWD6_SACSN|nr:hypothetical protein A8926_2660 [Saccharopolyspora spinosa]
MDTRDKNSSPPLHAADRHGPDQEQCEFFIAGAPRDRSAKCSVGVSRTARKAFAAGVRPTSFQTRCSTRADASDTGMVRAPASWGT